MATSGGSISPFRIVLLAATAIPLTAYAFVSLYSLLVGSIDFAWPLKTSLLTAIAIPVYFSANSLWIGWAVRKLDSTKVMQSGLQLVLEAGAFGTALYYAFPTLTSAFAIVDLTTVGLDVKFFVGISVSLMLIFLILIIYETVTLKRIGGPPVVPIPPKEKTQ